MDNFSKELYPTFRDLACDPYFMIRRTIACGLNEVMVSVTFNPRATLQIYSIFCCDKL
jgi:hypothetical protein